jgi:hypothetical protein
MAEALKPYEQAGRILRFFAWFTIVMLSLAVIGVIIPVISTHKTAGLSGFLALFAVLFGIQILSLYAGKAVKEHKAWGRKAGIICGLLYLPGFPVGTLVGGYVLYALITGWE